MSWLRRRKLRKLDTHTLAEMLATKREKAHESAMFAAGTTVGYQDANLSEASSKADFARDIALVLAERDEESATTVQPRNGADRMTTFERWMTRFGLLGAIATAIAALLGHLIKKEVKTQEEITINCSPSCTLTVPREEEERWSCAVTNTGFEWSMECR